jgi:hypothetical protein
MSRELFLKFLNTVYSPLIDLVSGDILTLKLFFALAFSAALTLFINKIFFSKEEKLYKLPTIQRIYPLQQNLFLFILMAFSLFLVLSAMIAIPFIGNPKNTFVSNTVKFDSALNSVKDARSSDATVYTVTRKDSNYVTSLQQVFTKSDTIPWKRDATKFVIETENENIVKFFSDKNVLIDEMVESHNKSIREFEQNKDINFADIQLKLKEPTSRLSFGTTDDYYAKLISWYSNSIKRNITYFKERQADLLGYDTYLKKFATDITGKYSAYQDTLRKIDAIQINNAGYYYQYDFFDLNSVSSFFADINNYQYSYNLFNVPLGAKKTRSLFGSIADWLTDTQSIDLVLIIGMFGFGLLGAAISSFITSSKKDLKDPTTPLVSDMSVVIIRGFSAAIVIFLATKGSIAVMNTGSNEPNPYVLFFACLVGSVFSERIWEWAKKQISTKFSEDDKVIKPQPALPSDNPKPGKPPERNNDIHQPNE